MLCVIRIKGCRRCGGDLFLERDIDTGPYLGCLQCGAQFYSKIFNDWRFPLKAKRLAIAIKRGRTLEQVQDILKQQYGKAPSMKTLEGWLNGNGKNGKKKRTPVAARRTG